MLALLGHLLIGSIKPGSGSSTDTVGPFREDQLWGNAWRVELDSPDVTGAEAVPWWETLRSCRYVESPE
jgi:hypothetical protein